MLMKSLELSENYTFGIIDCTVFRFHWLNIPLCERVRGKLAHNMTLECLNGEILHSTCDLNLFIQKMVWGIVT